jgi:hypothetical protein
MKRFIILAVVALFFASSASAFRPSARWVLLRAAQVQLKRKIQTLKIQQDTTVFGLKEAPRGYRTTQSTFVKTPFQLRETKALPDGEEIRVFTDKRSMTKSPRGEAKSKKAGPNLFLHLAAAGPPADEGRVADQAFSDLKKYGVDTGVVSFGRLDGKVAYVIGARPWEDDRSQVWIDKETFHLLKVLVVTKRTRVEMRYSGWGTGDVGGWWPKTIERLKDGKLEERQVTTSIQRNEPVDKDLFKTES